MVKHRVRSKIKLFETLASTDQIPQEIDLLAQMRASVSHKVARLGPYALL